MNYVPLENESAAAEIWCGLRNRMLERLMEDDVKIKSLLGDPIPYKPPIADFADIRQISLEILRRYPADQYFYVGLGRSPTPYVTFLEILHPDLTIHLPFSSAGWLMGIDSPDVSLEVKRNVYAHLDRFVPVNKVGGRKILIVEFAISGNSLCGGILAMKSWLAARKHRNKVKAFALVWSEDRIQSENLRGLDVYRYAITRSLTQGAHMHQEYDRWAKYGHYNPSYSLEENVKDRGFSLDGNSVHRYLREAIEWAMMKETEVSVMLKEAA